MYIQVCEIFFLYYINTLLTVIENDFIWFFLRLEYWFRKDDKLITLLNQHSNGILDFDSISELDNGQYICQGRNRVGLTEEIVTVELTGIQQSYLCK